MAVAAWPQREGLIAQLLPGLLVRLGCLLEVPVCPQLSIPERSGHVGIGHSVITNKLTPVYTQMMFQMIIINFS